MPAELMEIFTLPALGTILFLVFLEGILSMDNAIVLALLVKPLPPEMQKKALTYGIYGAFFFRIVSLFLISYIMGLWWIKLIGGAYLLYVAGKHFLGKEEEEGGPVKDVTTMGFWRVVMAVELMDIAFSVDSILAAVSLSPNYYIVLLGGIFGIITMRFAATVFVKLLDKFPNLEEAAFYLISIIGGKLVIQGIWPQVDFHHADSMATWIFWGSMAIVTALGFLWRPKGEPVPVRND